TTSSRWSWGILTVQWELKSPQRSGPGLCGGTFIERLLTRSQRDRLFSGDGGRLAQLVKRLADNHCRALQCKPGHNGRYDDIWPAGTCTKHANCREQHRQITEHVVACANPRRTHVGVALAESPKQTKGRRVGDKCSEANRTHRKSVRQRAV